MTMKKYIPLLIVCLIVSSCTKDEKGLDVSITGFVNMIDDYGFNVYDRSNVKVSIQDTIDTIANTTTDINGKYLFTGLKAGSLYNISMSKQDYGKITAYGNEFIGDQKPGLISTVTLYKIPSYDLTNATLESEPSGEIFINLLFTETDICAIGAYINDSSNVSDSHYDYSSRFSYTGGPKMTNFWFSTLPSINYSPGTTMYVAIYVFNYYDPGYFNSKLNHFIYSSAKKVGAYEVTL
jgi:hypothetical protein